MSSADAPELLDSVSLEKLISSPLALEERDDIATLVPALPVMAFVRIARQLKAEQRLDLLIPFAKAEQLTGLLDLEVWKRDRVDIPSARQWLATITEHRLASHLPRGALADLLYDMDPEMWTLGLYHLTAVGIVDLEDEQSRLQILDDMRALVTYETPDGYFIVGAPDNEFGRQSLQTIQSIYEDRLAEGRKLVLSIHSALASPIEEELLRWRHGRLADLGFPSREDAMQIFRPIPVHQIRNIEASPRFIPENLDATPVRVSQKEPLLSQVMAALDDAEHGIRSREFLLLANEIIVSEGWEPGDEHAQRRAIEFAGATLNLALEHYCAHASESGAVPVADLAQLIKTIGLRRLFRVGYGPLAKLRKACHELRRGSPISGTGLYQLLDRPWGAAAQSLGQLYPALPPMGTDARQTDTQPIRSLADLRLATRMLAECGALIRLAFDPNGLAIDPVWIARADEPTRVRIGDLIRSGLLHRLRHGSSRPFAPLDPDDLRWAAAELLDGGIPNPSTRDALKSLCDDVQAQSESASFGDVLLTRFAIELGAIESDTSGQLRLDRIGGFFTIQSVAVWMKTGLTSLERTN